MEAPSSFGLWVRQRRRALDMTQEALAVRVGCSLSAIRKIEGDERRPSLQIAELLAQALQIDAAQQSLFLRVARMDVRVDQLAAIAAPKQIPMPVIEPAAMKGIAASARTPVTSARQPAPDNVPDHASGSNGAAPSRAILALPVPPTPLVGREIEIAQIANTLLNPECRLLSLVGAGGIGKSRVAIAVAEQVAASFADGVAFVALVTVQATDDVAPQVHTGNHVAQQLVNAIAATLGIRQYGHADPLRQVLGYVRDKQLLLVLDSMEHLLDGGDMVIAELLREAPRLKIMATSREQLNLQGEWIFSVRGLSTPAGNVTSWESSSAMRLFVQSAQRAQVGFSPLADDLAAIARICRLVDGMPLAVELAASWVRVLSCEEIAREVERDWAFLSGATRDMPARHRSLRSVFEHSWALLSEGEQRALRRISVFRGGFRRDAAECVAKATLLDLASLTAKSLLNPVGGDRYAMHALIRQFAAEQLEASGEDTATRDRHAEWYQLLAQKSEPLLHGPEQVQWFNRLEKDEDNFDSALQWLTSGAAHLPADSGLRMTSSLWWYCFVRGRWNEIYKWQLHFYENPPETTASVRALALARLANMAWVRGDAARALHVVEEAMAVARASGDPLSIGMARYAEGQILTHSDPAKSSAAFDDALALARQIGFRWGEARALYRLGLTAFVADDLRTAQKYYQGALAIFHEIGDVWGINAAQSDAGGIYRREGNLALARHYGEQSLARCRELGFRQGLAIELLSLGAAEWGDGNFETARTYFMESLTVFNELDNLRGVADAHYQLGNTARWAGALDTALVEYDTALHLSRTQNFAPSIITALQGRAETLRMRGDIAGARATLAEAVPLITGNTGLRFILALLLESAAYVRACEAEGATRADAESAAFLLGASSGLRERFTVTLLPVERAEFDRVSLRLQNLLDADAFARAFARGAHLVVEDAIAAFIEEMER